MKSNELAKKHKSTAYYWLYNYWADKLFYMVFQLYK